MNRISLPLLSTLIFASVGGSIVQAQFVGSIQNEPGLELSGSWTPVPHEEAFGDPSIADYLGVPLNDAARAFGLAWDPSRMTVPEHQCQVHVSPYIYGGPLNLRIWEMRDEQSQRVVAIRQYLSTYEQNRWIWMDNRPHPPEGAAHTWMGFSTGNWEGNSLTVYTTHIKQGLLRRNGLPESDQATLIEHFILHPDFIVHVSEVTDPVYLTEPLVRTQIFRRITQAGQTWLFPCESVVEIANRASDVVPHYLPGENPFVTEFFDRYKIPRQAIMAGAESMYPDFIGKMKQMAAAQGK